jgi:hypothetical protein
MSRLFHRHHFKPVTRNLAVTPKAAVPQALPPLSPLSPLISLPLLLRGIEVWGCRLSPVTVVTGDTTGWRLMLRQRLRARTAAVQKFAKSQINVLEASMWLPGGWGLFA